MRYTDFLLSEVLYSLLICSSYTIASKRAAAAAAAKLLQSCPTLCNPIDGSPPGSPIPGILQARTLEWVAKTSRKGLLPPLSASAILDLTGHSYLSFA